MKPEQFDRLFHALADPYRRQMVERLAQGPASVKELASPIQLALPSALKHLKVLEEGGIVLSEKTGRVRTYRMRPQALSLAVAISVRRAIVFVAGYGRPQGPQSDVFFVLVMQFGELCSVRDGRAADFQCGNHATQIIHQAMFLVAKTCYPALIRR